MRQSKRALVGTMMAALTMPLVLSVGASSASADERDRYRVDKRSERYERRQERRKSESRWRYRNNSYSARANDLDPAGDYKGYPDWARVALSPKYDNRN